MTGYLKLSGTQSYVDSQTGDRFDAEVINLKQEDSDFQKIWVAQILAAAEELSSSRLKLVMYLVAESAKNQNMISATIRELASRLKMSATTVTKTLQTLEDKDIISRRPGVIFVNPDIVYKGSHHRRMNILLRYERTKVPLTLEQEQQSLADEIDALDKQKRDLEARQKRLLELHTKTPDRHLTDQKKTADEPKRG